MHLRVPLARFQYGPNIAAFLVANPSFAPNLKGLAVGNGCWGQYEGGGFACNGPHANQNLLKLFHGKGMLSNAQYDATYATCDFDNGGGEGPNPPKACQDALSTLISPGATAGAGPHNIYDVYDNCPLAGPPLGGQRPTNWV